MMTRILASRYLLSCNFKLRRQYKLNIEINILFVITKAHSVSILLEATF